MRCGRAQTGERKVREAARHGRAQTLQNFALVVVQTAQLRGERAINFFGGNLLKRAAKVRELTPNRAGREVTT